VMQVAFYVVAGVAGSLCILCLALEVGIVAC
jgi:hypothetical protein